MKGYMKCYNEKYGYNMEPVQHTVGSRNIRICTIFTYPWKTISKHELTVDIFIDPVFSCDGNTEFPCDS